MSKELGVNELMLDVGQANEFKLACRREGFTNEEIKQLCSQKGFLSQIKKVMIGQAEIVNIQQMFKLDPDADAHDLKYWQVWDHNYSKQNQFIMSKIKLYLSSRQQRNRSIIGKKLHKEVKDKPILNANVLDYLIKHPDLIPEEWKKKVDNYNLCILFWGTIYYKVQDIKTLYVPFLYWRNNWEWGMHQLSSEFRSYEQTALYID